MSDPDLDLDELQPLDGRAWILEALSANEIAADTTGALLEALGRLELAAGHFLVLAPGFGTGTTPEGLVSGLKAAGVGAVIACSFDEAFLRRATETGLPALVVEETGAIRNGDRLRVDLESRKIANLSSGDRYVIRNLHDDRVLDLLRAGARRTGEGR